MMKEKVKQIKDQMEIWKESVQKHPYSDPWATVQMGQLIAMVVGYISTVEDKIDKLLKEEEDKQNQ